MPGSGLAGLEQLLAVLVGARFRRTAASARSPAPSGSERSAHGAERKPPRRAGRRRLCCRCALTHSHLTHSATSVLLLARLACAVVIWRGLPAIGRCRQIVAPARLRFAALEIFAQRLLQSVLTRILFRLPEIFANAPPRSPLPPSSCIVNPSIAGFEIVGGILVELLTKSSKSLGRIDR